MSEPKMMRWFLVLPATSGDLEVCVVESFGDGAQRENDSVADLAATGKLKRGPWIFEGAAARPDDDADAEATVVKGKWRRPTYDEMARWRAGESVFDASLEPGVKSRSVVAGMNADGTVRSVVPGAVVAVEDGLPPPGVQVGLLSLGGGAGQFSEPCPDHDGERHTQGSLPTTHWHLLGGPNVVPLPGQLWADLCNAIACGRAKFPGNRFMLAALTEEVGELARALLQRKGQDATRTEALDVAAVALRIALEGDATFDDITQEESKP